MDGECPDENALAAYVDDNVEPDKRAFLEKHLAQCGACRETVIFGFRMSEMINRPLKKIPKA